MFIKLYLIALPIFFAIDMLWLVVISKNFYSQQLGYLMKTNVNFAAALLFYLLFIVGVVIFVVTPALDKNSLVLALSYGALFGLITYATYDLTNLATIKDWPLVITVVDLIWGTTLSTMVAGLTFIVAKRFGL